MALLAVGSVQAIPESDAAAVWHEEQGNDLLLAAGHTPNVVPAGTQWSGFIRFDAAANVTSAQYQICRVGSACFAPPTPANQSSADGQSWTFNTTDYRDVVYDEPIFYEAGWRVGVQWILTIDGDEVFFPHGMNLSSAACDADWQACAESHYLAFVIAPASGNVGEGGKGLPTAGVAAIAVALAVTAVGVRLRRSESGGGGG